MIPRSKHTISRSSINENAKKVLYRLSKKGFDSYLVGGSVRDLQLGIQPKDFDIATNASPEQIKKIFKNCRLIGRRFRLAHIYFGKEIIEVATFRAASNTQSSSYAQQSENGMVLRDNVFGTLEDDVFRRDFTVNALYYDIRNFSIIDFVGGVADLKERTLRIIGDPERRYREDPVRMLRAIRLSTKLDFTIAASTKEPIARLGPLLADIPSARMFDECLKIFLGGKSKAAYAILQELNLLDYLWPQTKTIVNAEPTLAKFIEHAMDSTDLRVSSQKSVNPAFLLATMLWPPVSAKITQLNISTKHSSEVIGVIDEIFSLQQKTITVPKKFLLQAKEIWLLQFRLVRRQGAKRARNIHSLPRFRAAYDFLLLRASVENDPFLSELADWWSTYIAKGQKSRDQMANSVKTRRSKRKRAAFDNSSI